MTEEFHNALTRIQFLQASTCIDGTFSVERKLDDWYGDYVNVTISNGSDRWFFTTMQCTDEDEYDRVINTISNILHEDDKLDNFGQ